MKHLPKSITVTLLACAASLTFAGCGGGSGDNPPPAPTRSAAAGFWGGPVVVAKDTPSPSTQSDFWDTAATDGSHAALVVLPTGETWIIYTSGGVIETVGHGQAQVVESSVTIRFSSFNSQQLFSGSYNGSVVPRSQLDLVPSSGGSGVAMPAIHIPTTYDTHYDQTPLPAQLAGTYTGTGDTYYSLSASAVAGDAAAASAAVSPLNNYAIAISSTGAVTLPPDPVGCSGAGTATPRTDSNVFDLSLQFSGAQCALGNGAKVNGIAVVENGHLLMLAVPPESSPAGEFVFISK